MQYVQLHRLYQFKFAAFSNFTVLLEVLLLIQWYHI